MAKYRSWWQAYAIGLLIFLFFAVANVWFVSFLITDLFANSGDFARDLLASAAWVVTLAVGVWGLRRAQQRGWI